MAIFRKVEVKFWSDSFVESLTPEQKYFYLYLMTNEKTTQCGIYECSIRKMSIDTGYNQETIQKLIEFFTEKKKIRYSNATNEICLRNWLKYNDSSSNTVQKCIENELEKVKDRVLIQYIYSMDTHSQEEEEKEQEKKEVKVKVKKEGFDLISEIEKFEYSPQRKSKIKEWVMYKEDEKKKKYKQLGFKAFLTQYDKYSDEEFFEMVDRSMANGWDGLFEIRQSKINQFEKQQQPGRLSRFVELSQNLDKLADQLYSNNDGTN